MEEFSIKTNQQIDLPPNPIFVKVGNLQFFFGPNQDKSKKLIGYSVMKPEAEFNTEMSIIVRKQGEKYIVTDIIYPDHRVIEEPSLDYRNTIEKFIDGDLPFYVKGKILYNRKHKRVCNVSDKFSSILEQSLIVPIVQDRYLLLRPQIAVTVLWDNQIAILQSSKLSKLHKNSIVLDSIMFNNFYFNEADINPLKELNTIEEAIMYIKRLMSLNTV
jgi:hypothetical protein